MEPFCLIFFFTVTIFNFDVFKSVFAIYYRTVIFIWKSTTRLLKNLKLLYVLSGRNPLLVLDCCAAVARGGRRVRKLSLLALIITSFAINLKLRGSFSPGIQHFILKCVDVDYNGSDSNVLSKHLF